MIRSICEVLRSFEKFLSHKIKHILYIEHYSGKYTIYRIIIDLNHMVFSDIQSNSASLRK